MPVKFPAVLLFGMLALLTATLDFAAQKAPDEVVSERAKAMVLVEANRYLDAYPILDKIAASFPSDVEVWTHYGIAIAARSSTLSEARERKAERKRAYGVLVKARELGTKNVMALSFLDQMSPDGGDEDNFSSANPEVEKALREGEQHFGKGEYDKAFSAYERAYKLDPKSYEAALFVGDTYYAQRKYQQSEEWFAKAVALDPDRELAYRFWGDALLNQGKIKEATEKFINAFVADPYSRYSWENINKLTEKYGRPFDVKGIFPPGTNDFGGITLDPAQFAEKDGTQLWLKYSETRESWRRDTFRKENPGITYRHSLKEELAALTAVADAAALAIKNGSLKYPHHSITNLLDIRSKVNLEPYVLLLLADEGIAEDFDAYRKTNREKLRRFLVDHVFVF